MAGDIPVGPGERSGLTEVLTTIQVELAQLRGQVNTLCARLEERLERQSDRQTRLDNQQADLKTRVAKNKSHADQARAELASRVTRVESNWAKITGIAIGSGLVGSGVAQALLQAFGS